MFAGTQVTLPAACNIAGESNGGPPTESGGDPPPDEATQAPADPRSAIGQRCATSSDCTPDPAGFGAHRDPDPDASCSNEIAV